LPRSVNSAILRLEVHMARKRVSRTRSFARNHKLGLRREAPLPGSGVELAGLLVGERGHPAPYSRTYPVSCRPAWLSRP
jgi:hypothetical protein